jgi:hypothetical protein
LHRKRQDKEDETGSDSDSEMSTSSVESDEYVPGFLDDPEMVQGRHRHVMIGDRVTGCIVSSTILYVDPEELKADLNKQFRERFDGWEPPKVCNMLCLLGLRGVFCTHYKSIYIVTMEIYWRQGN